MVEKSAILISEFQPLHKGHEDVIIQSISDNISKLFFCIDGAFRKLSDETIFSTAERETMIKEMMGKYSLPYSILHLRDSDNESDRISSLQQLLSPLSGATVLCDQKDTYSITKSLGYSSKSIYNSTYIPGILRNQIAINSTTALQKKLPEEVMTYLHANSIFTRARKKKIELFHGPDMTIDVVAINSKGEIAIIERKHEPYGKALPGGFIEFGDSGSDTTLKEAGEEIHAQGDLIDTNQGSLITEKLKDIVGQFGLSYPLEQQPFYVHTNPTRDRRGHITTLAYVMEIKNEDEIHAGDDAATVSFMKPEDALRDPEIFKDHKILIAAYMAQL